MAALSWVFDTQIIGINPNGDYLVEAKATFSDPALPQPILGNGTISVVATLDGNTPGNWATQIENAIIAYAASLNPPVTLTAARVILPMFS